MFILERAWPLETRTVGRMYEEADWLAYTCEDRVRPAGAAKVYGETAIPAGVYRVVLTMSRRFGRVLPLLCDVPGFSGIRIHNGMTEADTLGCILVGMEHDATGVCTCEPALTTVINRVRSASAHGGVMIRVG